MSKKEAVALKEYESIVELEKWATIEKRFGSAQSDT
jgi:hypothetical protein